MTTSSVLTKALFPITFLRWICCTVSTATDEKWKYLEWNSGSKISLQTLRFCRFLNNLNNVKNPKYKILRSFTHVKIQICCIYIILEYIRFYFIYFNRDF